MRRCLEQSNAGPCKVRPLLAIAAVVVGIAATWSTTEVGTAEYLRAPEPPSNLIAVPADLGIYLQWDASPTPVQQISEYRIERFREGDSAAVIIRRVPAGQLSDFDSTGLGGIEYRYRVRARDWFLNDSPWSDPAFATYRDPDPPAPPDSVSVVISPEGLFVDWVENSEPDLYRYRVYKAVEGAPFQPVAEPDQSQFLDGDVRVAVSYVYAVTALDHSGNESALSDSVSGFIADGVPPGKVADFHARGTADGVRLTWVAPTDSDLLGFRVARSRDPVFSDPLVTLGRADSTFVDSTALERVFYVYRIEAVDESGNYGEPSFADVIRPDATAPNAPTGFQLARTSSAIHLSWSPSGSSDLESYRIYEESLIDSSQTVIRVDGRFAEHVVFPFQPGLPRRYQVTAVDTTGNESAATQAIETALVPSVFERPATNPGPAFRLVSVPGLPAREWEFGGTRGVDWEVLDPLTLQPTPAGSTSIPGHGVWARATPASADAASRHTTADQVLQSNDGWTLEIPVEAGWNVLASPFDIAVDWDLVRQWNGVEGPLLAYQGSWERTRVLRPYEGAYWYNDAGVDRLAIPYSVERMETPTDSTAGASVLIRARRITGGRGQTIQLGGDLRPVRLPPTPVGLTRFFVDLPDGPFLGAPTFPETELELVWQDTGDRFEIQAVEYPAGTIPVLTDQHATPHILSDDALVLNRMSGRFTFRLRPSDEALPSPANESRIVEAFPNPIDSRLSAVYDIAVPGPIRLQIVDLMGRVVADIRREWKEPGRYAAHWELDTHIASGSYILTLWTSEGRTARMVQVVR